MHSVDLLKHKKSLFIFITAWIVAFTIGAIVWAAVTEQVDAPSITQKTIAPSPEPVLYDYIEIIGGCGPYFNGECAKAYHETDASSTPALELRTGIVLKISETIVNPDRTWYKITFDEWLRYPERVLGDLYVPADHVRLFKNEGIKEYDPTNASSTNKRIIIDRSLQMLYAYDGDTLFMEQKISTGILLTPTPRGTFTIFRKTPSRYMQGPIIGLNSKFYDLPGVPWDLYFTEQGGAIHGTYWHDHFGQRWSSGCVNLPPEQARILYEWAELGTTVTVRD